MEKSSKSKTHLGRKQHGSQPRQNEGPPVRKSDATPGDRLRSEPFHPPINDPQREKQLLEKGLFTWKQWLLGKTAPALIELSRSEITVRIAEVYRLCFESSGNRDLSILSEMIAHYPDAVFVAPWAKQLAWSSTFMRHHIPHARRVMQAFANGFRSAGAEHNLERISRFVRIFEAREFQKKMKGEFTRFLDEIAARTAEKGWLAVQINSKLEGIIAQHPPVATAKERLLGFLMKRQTYRASLLIASKKFRVRVRDLETAADRP